MKTELIFAGLLILQLICMVFILQMLVEMKQIVNKPTTVNFYHSEGVSKQ